jgi:hypothetical protein
MAMKVQGGRMVPLEPYQSEQINKAISAVGAAKRAIYKELSPIGQMRNLLEKEGFGPEINKLIQATKMIDDVYASIMLKAPRSLKR